jgi:hypothetical protein
VFDGAGDGVNYTRSRALVSLLNRCIVCNSQRLHVLGQWMPHAKGAPSVFYVLCKKCFRLPQPETASKVEDVILRQEQC